MTRTVGRVFLPALLWLLLHPLRGVLGSWTEILALPYISLGLPAPGMSEKPA